MCYETRFKGQVFLCAEKRVKLYARFKQAVFVSGEKREKFPLRGVM